tara:strand:+ start:143 stop:544 length:402 start_codon:yes stop_codon:yes gene_type:complete
MRVRLSYSVEIEEIPENIARLIENDWHRLDSTNNEVNNIIDRLREDEPNIKLIITKIDEARQWLGAFDARLNECEGILSGYEKAINTPPQPQDIPSQPQSPAPSNIPSNPAIDPETGAYNYKKPYSASEEPEE